VLAAHSAFAAASEVGQRIAPGRALGGQSLGIGGYVAGMGVRKKSCARSSRIFRRRTRRLDP
jgi:hypothetical protein